MLNVMITGNFGVVHKDWYSCEDTQTKVAIKTIKGEYYTNVYYTFT